MTIREIKTTLITGTDSQPLRVERSDKNPGFWHLRRGRMWFLLSDDEAITIADMTEEIE